VNPAAHARRRCIVFCALLTIATVLRPSGAAAGGAAKCIAYDDYLRWDHAVDLEGSARAIAVSGNHAYVVSADGLSVLQLTDPGDPLIVSTLSVHTASSRVAVSGDLVVILNPLHVSSLTVVDVSQPSEPEVLSTFPLPGEAQGLALSGAFAYVTRKSGARLEIVDLSDPLLPSLVGGVQQPDVPWCVSVAGSHAYVGLESGLAVVDVSDPANPVVTGSSLGWFSYGVDVAGNLAVVAAASGGVRVVDVSDPFAPVLVGTVPVSGWAYEVEISGDRAFVAERYHGLRVVDISDPAAPSIVGSVPTEGNEARDVALHEGYAYVAGREEGLQVIGYGIPESPPAVAGSALVPGPVTNLAASDGIACVGSSGLDVLDISDPSAPVLLGHLDVATPIEDIDIVGSRAYVATSTALQIVDLTDPATPEVMGVFVSTGLKTAVSVSGTWAFLARYHAIGGGTFLDTIDVSDPTSPSVVGSFAVNTLHDFVVEGTWAYLTTVFAGFLKVVDFSDPVAPVQVASIPLPDDATNVQVSGNMAYLGSWEAMYVVDITNPNAPVYLGETALPGQARALALSGPTAYVATGSWGVQIVDVSVVPPAIVGTYDTPGVVATIATSMDRIVAVDQGTIQATLEVLAGHCPASALASPLAAAPSGLFVGAVWPQPSFGTQRLPLTLSAATRLRVRVLDVRGAVVRTLADGRVGAGAATLHWDGRDDAGRPVAAGVYFIRGDGGASFARKAVRLR